MSADPWAIKIWAVESCEGAEISHWLRKHLDMAWPQAVLCRAEPVLLHPRQSSGSQTALTGGQWQCFWCSQQHLLAFGQDEFGLISESDSSVLRGICNVLSTQARRNGPSVMRGNENRADWVDTAEVGGKVLGRIVPSSASWGWCGVKPFLTSLYISGSCNFT